jgi:NitT/TauT family transport system permease protein
MAELALPQQKPNAAPLLARLLTLGKLLRLLIIVALLALLGLLAWHYRPQTPAPAHLTESTLGQLGLWMAEQSAEDAPQSGLGQLAKNWAASRGEAALPPAVILDAFNGLLLLLIGLTFAAVVIGGGGFLWGWRRGRFFLLLALLGLVLLLLIVPVFPNTQNDPAALLVQGALLLAIILLVNSAGAASKAVGFIAVLAALLLGWELFKGFAEANNYQIALSQPAWQYRAYPTLEAALAGLDAGEIGAVIVDENTVEDLIPADDTPADQLAAFPLGQYRILGAVEGAPQVLGLALLPALPKRSAIVASTVQVGAYTSISDLATIPLGGVEGDFALTRFLAAPRQVQLVNLDIGNDVKMPHLQTIAGALLQPARRNGPELLLSILAAAAGFTWVEAFVGFVIGIVLGFSLGTLFAHSRLLERGLMPYIVASQTIPILAIAPMIVIWLKAGWWSVAVIAAYLTFFPVTINTLRGLKSPSPTALELMQSYAASRWSIFIKLRLPAALPYIFTALKVSATASVVGAIIGELPSGIADGLGRAILTFNQYYATGPEKLWAAIFVAALLGIFFFLLVTLLERLLLPKSMRTN